MADIEKKLTNCPSCGKDLTEPQVYSFHKWATPAIVGLLSLMLILLDLVDDPISEGSSIDWSHWAVVGIWIFYITVQMLRFNPDYGWLLVPLGGVLFIIFFYFLDRFRDDNTGYLGLDWALKVIIPFSTFVVILPILSRMVRKQPSHLDILKHLVESLEVD